MLKYIYTGATKAGFFIVDIYNAVRIGLYIASCGHGGFQRIKFTLYNV